MPASESLRSAVGGVLADINHLDHAASLSVQEYGVVTYVGRGIARVSGLPNVGSEELVRFEGDVFGMTFNLDPDDIGVILLDDAATIESGSEVRRTNRVLD